MRKYIIADNQELTRFALEGLLLAPKGVSHSQADEETIVYRSFDRAGLVELLKEHESAVVLLDYTLLDVADEDQLLIIAERFSLSDCLTTTSEYSRIFGSAGSQVPMSEA